MKRIFALSCMLAASVLIYGQARDGTVEIKNRQHLAAVIELPYSPDIVTAALNYILLKKGKSAAPAIKGFTAFRNTQMATNDSLNADTYFKIDRKSRQDKEITVVSLLLNDPNTLNPMDTLRYLTMEDAKLYLNRLLPAVESYNLELVIKEQNESLIKAESKLQSLVNDGASLEEKRKHLDIKISDNRAEQQKQINEIEIQKKKLASRIDKRSS